MGAQIHKPFCETLDTQAATSISPTGGFSTSTATRINLRDIVRVEHASTQVAAVEERGENGSYDTVITATVEGLNIFNQVTADRIVAHLAVKHHKQHRRTEYKTIGSSFENLRIGGVPVHVDVDDDDGRKYHDGGVNHCVCDPYEPEKGRFNAEFDPTGHLTTLVTGVHVQGHVKHHRIRIHCNSIVVEDFGVVHLAEYIVTPNARYLNMLRVNLGCAVDGTVSVSGTSSNGHTVPTPKNP